MTDQEIIQLLKEAWIYADPEKANHVEKMSLEAPLSALGIESIAALEIAGYVEDKLGVQFPDSELTSITDVRGLVRLVRQYA